MSAIILVSASALAEGIYEIGRYCYRKAKEYIKFQMFRRELRRRRMRRYVK